MTAKTLLKCFRAGRSIQCLRLSTSQEQAEPELENEPERKILKVALVGRPNAGKSTLINRILNLNLCDASGKTHTTRSCFKTSFIRGDTQIIFMDTPGIVTQKEVSRFNLPNVFVNWKKALKEADAIGVIHELSEPRSLSKFHLKLAQEIDEFPENKLLFLILNKVDLIKDKRDFMLALHKLTMEEDLSVSEQKIIPRLPRLWYKFSRVFCTSALKDLGVKEMVDYLQEQAKPGKWVFSSGEVHNKPLPTLIHDLLRAQLMDVLPHEIPYQCKVEIEYLKENCLGEFNCVVAVLCKTFSHKNVIVFHNKAALKEITKKLESDMYCILKKVFRIRLVVVGPKSE